VSGLHEPLDALTDGIIIDSPQVGGVGDHDQFGYLSSDQLLMRMIEGFERLGAARGRDQVSGVAGGVFHDTSLIEHTYEYKTWGPIL